MPAATATPSAQVVKRLGELSDACMSNDMEAAGDVQLIAEMVKKMPLASWKVIGLRVTNFVRTNGWDTPPDVVAQILDAVTEHGWDGSDD